MGSSSPSALSGVIGRLVLAMCRNADVAAVPVVRLEGNRTNTDGGAGLGLSILRAIVIAHRGELIIVGRPAGGLDITVHFPAQAHSTDPELCEPKIG